MQAGVKMTTSVRAVVGYPDGTKYDHGIISGGGIKGKLSRLRVRMFGPRIVKE